MAVFASKFDTIQNHRRCSQAKSEKNNTETLRSQTKLPVFGGQTRTKARMSFFTLSDVYIVYASHKRPTLNPKRDHGFKRPQRDQGHHR